MSLIKTETGNSKKKHVKLLVVMPVGPDDSGRDTLDSIFCYSTSSVVILAIDDSRSKKFGQFLDTVDPRVIRLPSLGYTGIRGALWLNFLEAYRYACEHYTFDVLLRIDTDALLIGEKPEDEALAYFNNHPKVGMLGSYKVRSDGKKRSFNIVAYIIYRESSLYGIRNNKRRIIVKKLVRGAKRKGYRIGEHCQGGAVFQSYAAIYSMYKNNYLNTDRFLPLNDSRISEDHLFGLLTKLLGYSIEDFATGSLPMGIKWRGLPDSPENLVKQNKKVIHSIKFWEDMKQDEIRAYFANKRLQDVSQTKNTSRKN